LSELLNVIKKAALDAYDSSQPAAPFLGTVSGGEPLEITLHQRLILGESRLIRMEGCPELQEGDSVALLRFAGGQKYLILGRL